MKVLVVLCVSCIFAQALMGRANYALLSLFLFNLSKNVAQLFVVCLSPSLFSIHLTSLSSTRHLEFFRRLGWVWSCWCRACVVERCTTKRLMFMSLLCSTPEVKWCECCEKASSRGVHWSRLNGSFYWLMVSCTILTPLWSSKLLHLFYIIQTVVISF